MLFLNIYSYNLQYVSVNIGPNKKEFKLFFIGLGPNKIKMTQNLNKLVIVQFNEFNLKIM